MELHQIRYFLELSKNSHMSVAADLLNISQPALSRSIAALEKELGIQLFDRTGKRLKLNNNGKQFAIYAEKALNILDTGVESAKKIIYEMTGTLSILNYIHAPILLESTAAYAKLNPCVHMMVSQFSLGTGMKNGENPDFIICSSGIDSSSENQEQYWIRELLFEDEYVLAASDKLLYLPSDQISIRLDELKNYPFVTMPQRNIFFQDMTFPLCYRAGFYTNSPYQTDSYDIKLDLAAHGAALAILPKSCVKQSLPRFPNLRIYQLENIDASCPVWIFHQKQALMSEASLDFLEFILDYYNRPLEDCPQ